MVRPAEGGVRQVFPGYGLAFHAAIFPLSSQASTTGPFDVQLQRPGGFPIGVPNVKIPDKANEAKLVLNAPKNVKPATFKDVVVRVTARVGRATMTHEGRVNVAFVP